MSITRFPDQIIKLRLGLLCILICTVLVLPPIKIHSQSGRTEGGKQSWSGYRLVNERPIAGNLMVQHYELGNGLQVAIAVDRTAPVFTYQVFYRVGYADELPGQKGMSHLLEHLMFGSGTKARKQGAFVRQIKLNGGKDLNARTSHDETAYYVTLPDDKLPFIIDLDSDRMANLTIDSDALGKEKKAVFAEKALKRNNPGFYLWRQVYDLTYTVHNYRYYLVGESEAIERFTVEEIRQFYQSYYVPNNALIVIVGSVDNREAMRQIVNTYGRLEPRKVRDREIITEPTQTEERYRKIYHERVSSQILVKTWHIPNERHPDGLSLIVLGYYLDSVLKKDLMDSYMVTSLYTKPFMLRDTGLFIFSAQLVTGTSYEEVERIFKHTIEKLSGGGLNEEQMQIVKNNLLLDMYRIETDPVRLARFLGSSYTRNGNPIFALGIMDEIDNVTGEDVRRVAEKYILKGYASTVHLLPKQIQSKTVIDFPFVLVILPVTIAGIAISLFVIYRLRLNRRARCATAFEPAAKLESE